MQAQVKARRPLEILDLDVTKPFDGQVVISHEAAALLVAEYNKGNRRVRSSLVEYLLRQIKNGEWQSDHPQPIVFSNAGRLIDGQHRLIAISQSEREVTAMVRTGVRDALREYMDTGISRQLEDRVTFSADSNENKRIAQLINQWATLASGRPRGGVKPTPSEAVDIFEQHRDSVRFSANCMTRRLAGITAVPVMVALAEMWERDSEKAENFITSMYSPDGAVQQSRRLREYLVTRSARGATAGGQARQEIYLKCVGAMKAYLEDREVGALRSASWV